MVLIVLAILAALVVPTLLDQLERAKAAEAISFIGRVREGQRAYKAQHGHYASCGPSLMTSCAGFYVDMGFVKDDSEEAIFIAQMQENMHFGYFYTPAGDAAGNYTITAFVPKGVDPSNPQYAIIWNSLAGRWSGNHPGRPVNEDGS